MEPDVHPAESDFRRNDGTGREARLGSRKRLACSVFGDVVVGRSDGSDRKLANDLEFYSKAIRTRQPGLVGRYLGIFKNDA